MEMLDKNSVIKMKPVYCGRLSCGVTDVLRSLFRSRREIAGMDLLPQGRYYPTHLGRVGLWLLCKAWHLGPDDEILMPAYNCGSELSPFHTAGAKIVFYRVDPQARMDIADIHGRITDRTRVIYVIHYFGWPQNLTEVRQFCQERNIYLIEDCALSLFSTENDIPLGSTADAAIFSIRKFLPIPDGGLLVIRNQDIGPLPMCQPPFCKTGRNLLPLWKSHLLRQMDKAGLYNPAKTYKLKRFSLPEQKPSQDFPDMPSNYYFDRRIQNGSMSRISLGLIEKMDANQIKARRRKNYQRLYEKIVHIQGLQPLFSDLPKGVCPMVVPVLVQQRSRWVKVLMAHGISTTPFWEGFHRGLSWSEFPEAKYLKDHMLTLPIHQMISEKGIDFIAETVQKFSKLFT